MCENSPRAYHRKSFGRRDTPRSRSCHVSERSHAMNCGRVICGREGRTVVISSKLFLLLDCHTTLYSYLLFIKFSAKYF